MTPGEPPAETPSALDSVASAFGTRVASLIGRPTHPELTKVRERVVRETEEIHRLLSLNGGAVAPGVARQLHDVFKIDPTSRSIEQAWQIADALKLLALQLGDGAYVESLLANEARRARAGSRLSWNGYFEPEELTELLSAYRSGDPTPEQQRRALERLHFVLERRVDDGAHVRARVAMQRRYFIRTSALLGVLAVALGLAIVLAGEVSGWAVASAALAGALGGSLAGAFRLRSMMTIAGLRSVFGWLIVQPIVGASAALFITLLITSGLIGLPGTGGAGADATILAAYGFVAGYSEPFLLGVVGKIAGATTEHGDPSKTEAGKP